MKKFLKSNLFISLFINISVLLIVILFLGIYYETNDDIGMLTKAMSGGEFIVYQNIILGYFYKFLFGLYGGINWYTLFFVSLIFISSNVIILTVLNKVASKRLAIAISILFASTFVCDGYNSLQFTKVAGLVMAAGTMLAYSSIHGSGIKKMINMVFAVILIVLGSMIRFSVLYIAVVNMALLVLFANKDFFTEKNKYQYLLSNLSIVILFAVSVAFSLGLHIFDGNFTDKKYSDYLEIDHARSNFLDHVPKEYDKVKDQLSPIGISENDYKMVTNWCFADPDKFTYYVFKTLGDTASDKAAHSIDDSMKLTAISVKTNLRIIIFWSFVIVSLIFLMRFSKSKKWILYLLLLSSVLFIHFLLIFVEYRIMYRVIYCVWVYAYLLVVSLCDEDVAFSPKLLIVVYVCVFGLSSVSLLHNGKEKGKYTADQNDYYTFMSELKDDCVYFMSPNNPVTNKKVHIDALTTRFKNQNIIYLGGTGYGHPQTEQMWQRNNIKNPFKDIAKLDNAYLIATDDEFEMIFEYIKSNYYQDLKSSMVKEMAEAKVYKLYIKNQ